MQKKEIITLVAAIAAVFVLIFIVSAVRGTADDPASDSSYEPDFIVKTEEPVVTDIWDVLHEMQATTAPSSESQTVAVTALNENGVAYTVTDENGGAVTAVIQNPAVPGDSDVSEPVNQPAVTASSVPSDAPVIQVSPDQELPDDSDDDAPYFIAVPAE